MLLMAVFIEPPAMSSLGVLRQSFLRKRGLELNMGCAAHVVVLRDVVSVAFFHNSHLSIRCHVMEIQRTVDCDFHSSNFEVTFLERPHTQGL